MSAPEVSPAAPTPAAPTLAAPPGSAALAGSRAPSPLAALALVARRLLASGWPAARLLLASALISVLALAGAIYTIQVLNRFVAHGVGATLATLTLGALLALAFEGAFRLIRLAEAGRLGAAQRQRLAEAAFAGLVGADPARRAALPPGLRIGVPAAVERLEAGWSPPQLTQLLDLPFALLFLAMLALLSPVIGLIGLGAALALIALPLVGARPGPETVIQAQARAATVMRLAERAADTLTACAAGPLLLPAWRQAAAGLAAARGAGQRQGARLAIAAQLVQSAAALAVIGVGALEAVAGTLSVGALIGANILLARGLAPLTRLVALGESFAEALAAEGLLRQLASLPPEPGGSARPEPLAGALSVSGLALRWPEAPVPLFQDLAFEVPAGAVLAVTGSAGSGKSTLLRLLIGLARPDAGRILVDGVELRQLDLAWWRGRIGWLPQQVTLLEAPLGQNIGLARRRADPAALRPALEAVGLGPWLDRLPRGLDTPLAPATLSSDTTRRLGLARALVGAPPLLLLDEPTEGLDAVGVAQVFALLVAQARAGCTQVIVTREPRILAGATRVLDLDAPQRPRLLERRHG